MTLPCEYCSRILFSRPHTAASRPCNSALELPPWREPVFTSSFSSHSPHPYFHRRHGDAGIVVKGLLLLGEYVPPYLGLPSYTATSVSKARLVLLGVGVASRLNFCFLET